MLATGVRMDRIWVNRLCRGLKEHEMPSPFPMSDRRAVCPAGRNL